MEAMRLLCQAASGAVQPLHEKTMSCSTFVVYTIDFSICDFHVKRRPDINDVNAKLVERTCDDSMICSVMFDHYGVCDV